MKLLQLFKTKPDPMQELVKRLSDQLSHAQEKSLRWGATSQPGCFYQGQAKALANTLLTIDELTHDSHFNQWMRGRL